MSRQVTDPATIEDRIAERLRTIVPVHQLNKDDRWTYAASSYDEPSQVNRRYYVDIGPQTLVDGSNASIGGNSRHVEAELRIVTDYNFPEHHGKGMVHNDYRQLLDEFQDLAWTNGAFSEVEAETWEPLEANNKDNFQVAHLFTIRWHEGIVKLPRTD